MDEQRFFVVDLRTEWTRQPYITLWGPNHSGYNWSLSHAGRYTAEELDARDGYTTNRRWVVSKRARVGPWERFGVPCEVMEQIASDPDTHGRWRLDNGGGPIVRNSEAVRKLLRANRYVPKAKERA
jgi:hypothetical protein